MSSERKWAGEPWRDEEKLREAYINQDKTAIEIADEWGCCTKTICRWLHSFDIGTNPVVKRESETEFGWVREYMEQQIYGFRPSDEQRERIMDEKGHECEECGMSREKHREEKKNDLHIHHIVDQLEFLNEDGSVKDEAHHPINTRVLCAKCHRRQH